MQDEIRESNSASNEKLKRIIKCLKTENESSDRLIKLFDKMYLEKCDECKNLAAELKAEQKRKVYIRRSEIETRYFFTMWTYLLAIITMLKNKVIMTDLISFIKSLANILSGIGKVEFELIRIIASVTYHIPNYTLNFILHWLIIAVLMLILNGAVGLFLHKGFYLIGSTAKKRWDKKQTAISAIIVVIFTVLGDVLPFKTILHINLVALAILIFILTIIIRIIKFHKKNERSNL